MKLILSPQRRDELLVASVDGDLLTLNGQEYDFAQIPEGGQLPMEAIACDLFVGPVERLNGELVVRLVLPLGPAPSIEAAFPGPITIATGRVNFPDVGL